MKTDEVQRGFVPRRDFLSNVANLDAAARRASISPTAPEDFPVFAAYDIEAASPSLGRQWLFQILSRFLLPEGFLYFIRALCVFFPGGFARTQTQVVFLIYLCSGVPQGARFRARFGRLRWIRF